MKDHHLTIFNLIWLKRNCWSFQPNRPYTATSMSTLTPYRLLLPKQQDLERKSSFLHYWSLLMPGHIASVSRSCRCALYNIRKIRPYLTQYATQLLVQTLVSSRLDYCNALLTGLPA